MSLLCLLLTCLSRGFHLGVINFLNTVTGHIFTNQISSLGKGFHYEVPNGQMPIAAFLIIYALLCLLSVMPLSKLRREHIASDQDLAKRSCNLKSPLTLILLFSLIFRVLLIFSTPVHESDFYRYLWDGKVATHSINPYRFEPGALKLHEQGITTPYLDANTGVTWRGRVFNSDEKSQLEKLTQLRDDHPVLHERVSHQAVPTIYPPVAQAVFSLSAALFGDSLIGLKVLLLIFDALIIAVMIQILHKLELNPAWVIVYAWSPLVLKEFANSAHYDAIPLFFTLLAIYTALKATRFVSPLATGNDERNANRTLSTATSLALGTLAKFFSVILLPVLIPPRLNHWRSYLLFSSIIFIAYLPFFFWSDTGIRQVFAGLGVYNQHWQYNAGLFALIQQSLSLLYTPSQASLLPAKILVALILIAILCRQTFGQNSGKNFTPTSDPAGENQRLLHRCFVMIAALFILSPTAFPWYYTWVMPFLCVFPSRSWIMLSWLLPLSYLDFHQNLSIARSFFWHIPAISWIIWGTFALLFFTDFIKLQKAKTTKGQKQASP